MSAAGDLVADRYRLQQRLGSGAMGVVWQAQDERLQRQVAIKQLLLQPGLEPEQADQARQRAMREGRVAARLHHPHAISVYDVVVDDGLPVLVMEHLPSRSLAEILAERGSLAPETVARIGAESASALAAAHAAGVVHRDIKPGNLLIAEDGTAKITDFGISHAAGDVALTQTGLVAGTPAFLAPEVARGEQPTASSDIFSLGATLYAAVEGTPPFGAGGENPLALLHKVAAGDVPPPQQAGSLTPVLNGMLGADPETRPSAREVGDALHAVAAGDSLPATLVDTAATWHTWETTQLAGATGQVSTARNPRTLTDVPAEQASGAGDTVSASSPTGDRSRSGRRRKRALVLALLAAAVVAGVVLFALLSPGDKPPAPRSASMAPAAREKAVSEYYALLPDEANRAWNRLSPKLQEQGKQSYLNRWSAVSSVSIVSAPEATGKDAVRVGIKLTMPNGTKITQFHRLGLVANKNALLINRDQLLRSETSAPAAPPARQTEENQPSQQDRGEDRGNKQQDNSDGQPTSTENPGESETTEQTTTPTQAPEEPPTTEEGDQSTEPEESPAS